MAFTLAVNGAEHRVDAPQGETLLNVLRNHLGLTGTKYGCGEGQCGACTVLIEGSMVRSCRMQVSSAAGKKITTDWSRQGDRQIAAALDICVINKEDAKTLGHFAWGKIHSPKRAHDISALLYINCLDGNIINGGRP